MAAGDTYWPVVFNPTTQTHVPLASGVFRCRCSASSSRQIIVNDGGRHRPLLASEFIEDACSTTGGYEAVILDGNKHRPATITDEYRCNIDRDYLLYVDGRIATSKDGLVWVSGEGSGNISPGQGAVAGNGVAVSIPIGPNTASYAFARRPRGWGAEQFPSAIAGHQKYAVAFGGGYFGLISRSGTISYFNYSSDGLSWTSVVLPIHNATLLAYGNGRWMCLGISEYASSTDRTNWTSGATPMALNSGGGYTPIGKLE